MTKQLLYGTAFCCVSALMAGQAKAQTANGFVGIGTTTPKARLHINSDTSGILIPKYATLALVNSNCLPKLNSTDHKGLQVYVDETANRGFWFYNGTAFEKVGGSGGGSSSSSTVYGDGSAGALNITVNTDWVTTPPTSFNFQFTTINVASGVTLTVPSGTKLRATGNVTVTGSIVVSNPNNPGVGGNAAVGIARTSPASDTGGVALGITKGQVMSLINIPPYGGGNGGPAPSGRNLPGMGGGSFAIYTSGSISIAAGGAVRANGSNTNNVDLGVNSTGSGGGGGGLIVLMSKTSITNSGTISANGGNGGDGVLVTGSTPRAGGGGGGGGVVCFLAPTAPVITGSVTLNAGTGGTASGSGSTTSFSIGGGASGGNGGRSAAGTFVPAGAGTAGFQVTITAANPENLY